MPINIRPQLPEDAQRFYEILNNKNFIFLDIRPESPQSEKDYIISLHTKNSEIQNHNFSILLDDYVIGGIGVKIDQHRTFIGEIGYFIDEAFWGKWYAPKAVAWVEDYAFRTLWLERLEIIVPIKHTASTKVALKAWYTKEGTMKQKIEIFWKYYDAYLYAKTREESPIFLAFS